MFLLQLADYPKNKTSAAELPAGRSGKESSALPPNQIRLALSKSRKNYSKAAPKKYD